jgi:hypothetical protein
MNTKHIHHIHPHLPFPYTHPPPMGTNPWKRPVFFPPALHYFFKCILMAQKGFVLVLQVFVYCALIKLNLWYLLILCHHVPLIFNSLQYSALYYIHI